MRFAFLTAGTRGDTQPYVALASELVRRGHQAVIAVNEDLAAFASKAGVEAVPYAGVRMDEVFGSQRGKELLARGKLLQFLSVLQERQKEHTRDVIDGMLLATERADVIVPHAILEPGAWAFAQWKQVPLIRTHLAPITPTRAFASPLLGHGNIPWGALRHWTHRLVRTVSWRTQRSAHESACRLLGVRPFSGNPYVMMEQQRVPCAHLVSPTLLPAPPDWPAHHVVTGHCSLPRSVQERLGEGAPTPSLEHWLQSGTAPIYFGFGSIPILSPLEFIRSVRAVLAELGLRGLVITGGSDLRNIESDEHLFFVPSVNHDEVLPRCRAAVHHGGLGTTTASLSAGLPTLVCSVLLDQPFWGARVQALGAGTWMPFQRLTPERLRKGLELLLSDAVRARAEEVGIRMRQESGLQNTADFLEQTVGGLRA